MAGGLAALLDDIAALARVAAASIDDVSAAAGRASAKAAGVVVDDAAVTPQYVQGVAAERELPIIRKIATGSIRNKLLFILPAAMLLSQFVPFLLNPILMCGGLYLSYEGAEKLWEKISGHDKKAAPAAMSKEPQDEKTLVAGAVRTDFILSAEIMVIALKEVADQSLVSRAVILAVVAVFITIVVYGAVALIVKMDDIGLRLAQRDDETSKKLGMSLVRAMPTVLRVIGGIGMVAMLWVGGHILLAGAKEMGWSAPYDLVHHVEVAAAGLIPAIGGFIGWLTNTSLSAVVGVACGAVLVAIMHVLPFGKKHAH